MKGCSEFIVGIFFLAEKFIVGNFLLLKVWGRVKVIQVIVLRGKSSGKGKRLGYKESIVSTALISWKLHLCYCQ